MKKVTYLLIIVTIIFANLFVYNMVNCSMENNEHLYYNCNVLEFYVEKGESIALLEMNDLFNKNVFVKLRTDQVDCVKNAFCNKETLVFGFSRADINVLIGRGYNNHFNRTLAFGVLFILSFTILMFVFELKVKNKHER